MAPPKIASSSSAYNTPGQYKSMAAWEAMARLHLIPHDQCPVARSSVNAIVAVRHQIVDFTLPFGRVLHDYLA